MAHVARALSLVLLWQCHFGTLVKPQSNLKTRNQIQSANATPKAEFRDQVKDLEPRTRTCGPIPGALKLTHTRVTMDDWTNSLAGFRDLVGVRARKAKANQRKPKKQRKPTKIKGTQTQVGTLKQSPTLVV